jgi:hypothetical protein
LKGIIKTGSKGVSEKDSFGWKSVEGGMDVPGNLSTVGTDIYKLTSK